MKKFFVLMLAVALCLTMAMTPAMAGTAKTLPLKLMANPTTGYIWQIDMQTEGIVSFEEGDYTVIDDTLMGSGGYYNYVVVGQQAGEVVVALNYQRADDSESALYTLIYTFLVDADFNVYVADFTYSFE